MISYRHMRVVNNYMQGMSKKDSLLAAGYSESVANTDAESVFGRPDVEKEIQKRFDRMAKRNELTEDWVVNRLMTIADANVGDLLVVSEDGNVRVDYERITPELRYALGLIESNEYKKGRGPNAVPVHQIKVKFADKLRALEMLMKVLGLDRTKVEVTGEEALMNKLLEGRARVSRGDDAADSE